MPPDDRQRLIQLIGEASSLPKHEREAFVRSACPEGPVRDEALALLATLERSTGFLEPRPQRDDGAEGAVRVESPGASIGHYKLLQRIGEGGFGVVFMAEQREPVRRLVALKVIKLGMDTAAVVARFEAERQALALMDHPNIAKVLDAGATDSGRPYFVMELVRGDPISQYCTCQGLSTHERLLLFTQVCRAVQHAHTKGIIHRDIKPGNVLVALVDGKPVPKVIDFGIAKATNARLTERTLFTEFRQVVGTPEYMSPEQANDQAHDVDTRTDIYSLGVLLYELVTDATPFDPQRLRSAAWAELQRIIREEDPPRPSTRLSALRASQPDSAGVSPQAVRGDIDWIIMRCLEKDRARRYQTADALAEDIGRHLMGEPIVAAPPSATYRIHKFVRRHRVGVSACAATLIALVLAVVGATWGMMHVGHARDRALEAQLLATERFEQAEKARAEEKAAREHADRMNSVANAVTEFFTQDVLDASLVAQGQPEPTLRQMLDAVPAKIDQHFKSEPAVEGVIRERVGELYRRLGDLQRAEAYLVAAIPLLEKGLGPESRPTLSATHRLGEWMMDMGRYAEAAALFDKAYQGRLRAFGMEYNLTGNSLLRRGDARVLAGEHEAGLADIRQAWDHFNQRLGVQSRSSLMACNSMAEAFLAAGRPMDARDALIAQLRIVEANPEKLGQFEEMLRQLLGDTYAQLGDYPRALEELDKALAQARTHYPESHIIIAEVRWLRGVALRGLGRPADARAEWEAAYPIAQSTYGAHHKVPLDIARNLAELAAAEGNQAEADRWREKLAPR